MKLRLPLLLLLAAFSAKAQRIVILPPPGKATPAHQQVRSLLCEQTTAECVNPSSVMTQKKVDWRKIKKHRVQWVLSTTSSKKPTPKAKPTKQNLTVTAQNASTKKIQTKASFPLSPSGTLSASHANKLRQTFSNSLKIRAKTTPHAWHEDVASSRPPPGDFYQSPP
ncbi:MAG: hypothetical protein FWB81_08430, partial [Cystobacterineae bacterium]|nr:hypothetical protein [Cystobacterineae bacterium]